MKKMPKVSILCATRNEIGTIDKHLSSLVNQCYKNKEIIIVDHDSTDGTSDVAKNYAIKYKDISYFKIDYHVGTSHTEARLFGIKKIKGDILFIVDSDAYYAKDYVKLCINTILSDNNVAGVIGRMKIWNPKNLVSKYRSAWYNYKFNNSPLINNEIKNGRMAAWIFRKDIYDMIGGYDPKNHYGEDVDLAKRMQEAGYKVLYQPDALWYHKWEDTPISLSKKFFNVGKLNFYHMKHNLLIYIKVFYFFLIIPLVILSLFFPIFWILVILHTIPLLLNMGYRLYLCRRIQYWQYILFYPLISYAINVPYSFGFLFKLFRIS